MKEGPGGEAGAFKETSQSRDEGALDPPILSQCTNQARRGTKCNVPGCGWWWDRRLQWSHAVHLRPRLLRKPGLFFRPRRDLA